MAANYTPLENCLVLTSWFFDLLGFKSNRAMLEDLAQASEGFDASGRSFLVTRLASRARCSVSAEDLDRYDINIQRYLAHINRRRTQPLVLRYFQHLSLLASEVYLDRLSSAPKQLLADLNSFVHQSNTKNPVNPFPEFNEADLNKLAFWMATGSGKTILFHIHYLQFLHYRPCEVENILLITPNANLSVQHLAEMEESNIPCERFQLDASGLRSNQPNCVRVIEITKLVEEKKGGGESVSVEYFEGKNLIFVDEGHKGTGSEAEAFVGRRQALAKDGFTFEYSATFGQALDASKRDAVTREYAKAILFDYSYRYFYGDGFGKNFHILNLKETKDEEAVDTLLLANLLSFFEQRFYFFSNREAVREYGLEAPLWLLVGSRVTTTQGDTLRVIQFLARFLSNQKGWAEKTIGKILKGESGIFTTDNRDLFDGHLNYLRQEWTSDPDNHAQKAIYHQILSQVFNAEVAGELQVLSIGSSKDEIGLRVSGSDTYFGLLYIGDVSKFRKLVEKEAPELKTGDDAIISPLFPTVKQPESSINLLIGAKKFMEGWSSWRVSNMGLLNVGRSEGSEIIQLFGRGVRLRGWGRLLKRSEALPGLEHPPHLPLLETLNIFAIRADYMSNFKSYLEREGVPTDGYESFDLSVFRNEEFLKEGLLQPRLPAGKRFIDEENLILSVDKSIVVKVDMTTRVRALHGGEGTTVETVDAKAGTTRRIESTVLHHINWDQIHLALIDYKQERNYHNLAIPRAAARSIIEDEGPLYELSAPESWLKPGTVIDVKGLRETVISILKKYIDRQYRKAQKQWESRNMVVDELTGKDPNLKEKHQISVPKSDPELLKVVSEVIEEARQAVSAKKKAKVHEEELPLFPNLIFERHLYQPLLVIANGKAEVKGGDVLNDSETTFVKDLRDFYTAEKTGILKGKQLFLLRNLGRGKGIGFFEDHGFFPDFILWIKEGRSSQRIIFVEPHGLLLGSDGPRGEKLQLHESLAEHIAPGLAKANLKNVSLDAFVVSSTPFAKLREKFKGFDGMDWSRKQFLHHHVLFQEPRSGDYDYIKALCQ